MNNRHLFLTLGLLAASAPANAELRGEPEAIERVELMIERLGGATIWSQANSLYLEYEGWRSDPAQPVDERAWRSLATPDQRVIFEGRRGDVTFSMTPETSWLEFSNRDPRMFNDEEHADNLNFWNYDFYTVLYNLARGDARIRVTLEEPRVVRLSGPNNADWGWFEIDDTGQPVRWGATSGDDQLEYLYGPVKAFGNINFPAWGTAVDGFWRFDYKTVDVSREPFVLERQPPTGEE